MLDKLSAPNLSLTASAFGGRSGELLLELTLSDEGDASRLEARETALFACF
jgi:hypothetical protein